jgi:hypothetical protein
MIIENYNMMSTQSKNLSKNWSNWRLINCFWSSEIFIQNPNWYVQSISNKIANYLKINLFVVVVFERMKLSLYFFSSLVYKSNLCK